MEYDVAVIGCGPAGMTAAVYAARKVLKCVVFEGKSVGGAMAAAPAIENYPGFGRISGVELGQKMRAQVDAHGVEVVSDGVVSAAKKGDSFVLTTNAGETYSTKTVILATGSEYKKLGVKGEEEFAGKGVSYCAACDAPMFKNKRVAVIGGGNSALTCALYIAAIASKAYLIHRSELKADEQLVQRVRETGKVDILLGVNVVEVLGDKFVKQIKLKDKQKEWLLDVDGVFVNVGVTPTSDLAKALGVELDEKNFIRVDSCQRTSVEGVYAAGDCTGHLLQVVWACAEGANAALRAYDWLKKEKPKLRIEH